MNQSNKALRDLIKALIIMAGTPHVDKETVADQILALVTNHIKGALPEWANKAYYTKHPVLWKPVAPESNAEHYDAGFNQAIELVHQLLEEVSNETKM